MIKLLTLSLDEETGQFVWEVNPQQPVHASELAVALKCFAHDIIVRNCRPMSAKVSDMTPEGSKRKRKVAKTNGHVEPADWIRGLEPHDVEMPGKIELEDE